MKKIITLIVSLITILSISACGSGSGMSNTKLSLLLNSNDVSGAVNYYLENCSTQSQQNMFVNSLIAYGEDAYSNYNHENISYEQAHDKCNTVVNVADRLNLNYDFRSITKRLSQLNHSKEKFEDAQQWLSRLKANPNGNEYSSANDMVTYVLDCCSAVQEDDTNYPQVQALMDEALEYYTRTGESVIKK